MGIKPGTLCLVINCDWPCEANNGAIVEVISFDSKDGLYHVKVAREEQLLISLGKDDVTVDYTIDGHCPRRNLLPVNDPGLDLSVSDKLLSPISEETNHDTCHA